MSMVMEGTGISSCLLLSASEIWIGYDQSVVKERLMSIMRTDAFQ